MAGTGKTHKDTLQSHSDSNFLRSWKICQIENEKQCLWQLEEDSLTFEISWKVQKQMWRHTRDDSSIVWHVWTVFSYYYTPLKEMSLKQEHVALIRAMFCLNRPAGSRTQTTKTIRIHMKICFWSNIFNKMIVLFLHHHNHFDPAIVDVFNHQHWQGWYDPAKLSQMLVMTSPLGWKLGKCLWPLLI